MSEDFAEARLGKLLRLLLGARHEGRLLHRPLRILPQPLGEMMRTLDFARPLLVGHMFEGRVDAVAGLGLLDHRGELELADQVVELLGAEEHRVQRRRVEQLLRAVQSVHPLEIVSRARVLVGENLIGFAELLEARVGLRVVRVLVGMHLAGEHQVRSLDLRGRRVRLHAEHLVEARVRHAGITLVAGRRLEGLTPRGELLGPLGVGLVHRLDLRRQAVVHPLPALLVPLLALGRAVHRKRRLHSAASDLSRSAHTAGNGHDGGGADALGEARSKPLGRADRHRLSALATRARHTLIRSHHGHCH